MRKTTTAAALVAIGSTAALALATSGASASAAHPRHAAAAAKTSLHGWTQVSDHSGNSASAIGLARFNGNLEAVWVGNGSGNTQTLDTRVITPSGHTASADTRVVKWDVVNFFPQVVKYGSGLTIAFAGQQDTVTSNPYSYGLEYLETSSDGKTWALQSDTLSQLNSADGSYGSDLAVVDGDLTLVYTAASANSVTYSQGYEPISGAEQGNTTHTTSQPGADLHYTGLGVDTKSDKTWTIWDSVTGGKNVYGVTAQQILPTRGTLVRAPGTVVKSNGGYFNTGVSQRMDVAARSGGGLYASYGVGYPMAKHVALWRLGASKAKLIPSGGDEYVTDVAAGPNGRVWVFWFDAGQTVIHVARTNTDATKLGASCKVATPHGTSSVYELAGNGSQGPLQLFINAGSNVDGTQIYDKTVEPCLSVHVSPHKVPQGGHITVTVTDAGSPVEGAKVSFAGSSDTTDKHGVVTLHVSSGTSPGSHSVRVALHGYETAHAKATVTKRH